MSSQGALNPRLLSLLEAHMRAGEEEDRLPVLLDFEEEQGRGNPHEQGVCYRLNSNGGHRGQSEDVINEESN